MALTTNRQLEKIVPSKIRELDEIFRSVDGCIMMTMGEPDFGMPENVKEAAITAIKNDVSHYSHSMGTLDARQAVAEFLKKRHNLDFDPASEIILTIGATEAIYSALFGVLNPGEKVIVPSPYFPLYKQATTTAYGETIEVDTSQTGFLMTPQLLHQTMAENENVKAIVLNFPSNPTGVTYMKEELVALAEAIKQYDIFVISDEIYSELTYGVDHLSMASLLPDQTILINGASKSFAMTGWRVGFIAAKKQWIPPIFKVHQTVVTTGVSVSYAAAAEAFRNGEADIERMRMAYETRRNICLDALTKAGFTVPEPKGAFYVFARIPEKFGNDDMAFCQTLAKEARVGMIPGSIFGPGGEGYVRMSFALATDLVEEAMQRVSAFVG
ncbi:aminotransferase class I/II-fold pyridoxal phosphate-dependent enzyme [Jeotgalibaca sp. A122]|uniref:aminotransferase class I/II-fold pyridoxal phosphate-dependent enzyme n=1 Tax=Jeotgalibaca sp. A122 TaxID=3457322 RepID=UPI003FD53F70